MVGRFHVQARVDHPAHGHEEEPRAPSTVRRTSGEDLRRGGGRCRNAGCTASEAGIVWRISYLYLPMNRYLNGGCKRMERIRCRNRTDSHACDKAHIPVRPVRSRLSEAFLERWRIVEVGHRSTKIHCAVDVAHAPDAIPDLCAPEVIPHFVHCAPQTINRLVGGAIAGPEAPRHCDRRWREHAHARLQRFRCGCSAIQLLVGT